VGKLAAEKLAGAEPGEGLALRERRAGMIIAREPFFESACRILRFERIKDFVLGSDGQERLYSMEVNARKLKPGIVFEKRHASKPITGEPGCLGVFPRGTQARLLAIAKGEFNGDFDASKIVFLKELPQARPRFPFAAPAGSRYQGRFGKLEAAGPGVMGVILDSRLGAAVSGGREGMAGLGREVLEALGPFRPDTAEGAASLKAHGLDLQDCPAIVNVAIIGEAATAMRGGDLAKLGEAALMETIRHELQHARDYCAEQASGGGMAELEREMDGLKKEAEAFLSREPKETVSQMLERRVGGGGGAGGVPASITTDPETALCGACFIGLMREGGENAFLPERFLAAVAEIYGLGGLDMGVEPDFAGLRRKALELQKEFAASPTRENFDALAKVAVLADFDKGCNSVRGAFDKSFNYVSHALASPGFEPGGGLESLSRRFVEKVAGYALKEHELHAVSEAKAYALVNESAVPLDFSYPRIAHHLCGMLLKSRKKEELSRALKGTVRMDEAYRTVRDVDPWAYASTPVTKIMGYPTDSF
jgi:hypothetical protein